MRTKGASETLKTWAECQYQWVVHMLARSNCVCLNLRTDIHFVDLCPLDGTQGLADDRHRNLFCETFHRKQSVYEPCFVCDFCMPGETMVCMLNYSPPKNGWLLIRTLTPCSICSEFYTLSKMSATHTSSGGGSRHIYSAAIPSQVVCIVMPSTHRCTKWLHERTWTQP